MITEEEKARRRKSINYAKASMVLSGIVMPDELLQLADEYVEGKYTWEEYNEKYREVAKQIRGRTNNTEETSSYMELTMEEIIKLREEWDKDNTSKY